MAPSDCANSRRSRRFGDNDEPPDDVENDENYVAIPDKRELGLGNLLALSRQTQPNY
jgi:hypothetical protein